MPALILGTRGCPLHLLITNNALERSGSLPPEVKAGPSPPPVSPLPWQSLRGVRQAPAPPCGSARPATTTAPALADRAPSRCSNLKLLVAFHVCHDLESMPRARPSPVVPLARFMHT